MRKIKIGGEAMKLYVIGFGELGTVFYNRTTKEATGHPRFVGRSPRQALIDAIMRRGDPPEPRYVEVTNQEHWRRAMCRFRQ
jgi:hypothetical protein